MTVLKMGYLQDELEKLGKEVETQKRERDDIDKRIADKEFRLWLMVDEIKTAVLLQISKSVDQLDNTLIDNMNQSCDTPAKEPDYCNYFADVYRSLEEKENRDWSEKIRANDFGIDSFFDEKTLDQLYLKATTFVNEALSGAETHLNTIEGAEDDLTTLQEAFSKLFDISDTTIPSSTLQPNTVKGQLSNVQNTLCSVEANVQVCLVLGKVYELLEQAIENQGEQSWTDYLNISPIPDSKKNIQGQVSTLITSINLDIEALRQEKNYRNTQLSLLETFETDRKDTVSFLNQLTEEEAKSAQVPQVASSKNRAEEQSTLSKIKQYLSAVAAMDEEREKRDEVQEQLRQAMQRLQQKSDSLRKEEEKEQQLDIQEKELQEQLDSLDSIDKPDKARQFLDTVITPIEIESWSKNFPLANEFIEHNSDKSLNKGFSQSKLKPLSEYTFFEFQVLATQFILFIKAHESNLESKAKLAISSTSFRNLKVVHSKTVSTKEQQFVKKLEEQNLTIANSKAYIRLSTATASIESELSVGNYSYPNQGVKWLETEAEGSPRI